MQICHTCGKEVKYIAGTYNKTYTCETQEKQFVTDNGHLFYGYELHKCAVDKQAEKPNNEPRE